MSLDSSWYTCCHVWLLSGILAVMAGCSSPPEKGAGSSGSGPAATGSTPPVTGQSSTSPSNLPSLSFGPGSKSNEPASEPVPTLPGVETGGKAADTSPITVPPDVSFPTPADSGTAKPKGSAAPRNPGEPIPEVPKKTE